jgi:hypothetical protein
MENFPRGHKAGLHNELYSLYVLMQATITLSQRGPRLESITFKPQKRDESFASIRDSDSKFISA